MSNNRKTLISMRLDNDVISQLDYFMKLHHYYSRTSIVCHLMRALFQCGGNTVVHEILRHFNPYDEGIVITISKTKKK